MLPGRLISSSTPLSNAPITVINCFGGDKGSVANVDRSSFISSGDDGGYCSTTGVDDDEDDDEDGGDVN